MYKTALYLTRLGIDTHKEAVIYMRKDCHICLSEGFEVHARVKVMLNNKSIIATLNIIDSDLLKHNQASLSQYAWDLLDANEGDEITVIHTKPVNSLSYIRSKIYGNILSYQELKEIITDISLGRYSDIYISSFLTACVGNITKEEIVNLTKAMIEAGDCLKWDADIVVDKHCIGGLPGNRTTPIIVAIVAAFGLTIPKTSSRAITSPAGTADTMEVLTNVNQDTDSIKNIVSKENACIIWGGSVNLSPADDILIRVEKALNLDNEGQLIASVLSKKIAAGSTHILIDIPIGSTAKVRSKKAANKLKEDFEYSATQLGVNVKVIFSDGSQPIGRGVGPALEAEDIISILQCKKNAPQDLRKKSIILAANIIEFSPKVKKGEGIKIATDIIDSGKAWEKFRAICQAQGGIYKIPKAKYNHPYLATKGGIITAIDNRQIALIASLAGAPEDKTAGVLLNIKIGSKVKKGDVILTIYSNSPGELKYVLNYLNDSKEFIKIK